MKTQHDGQGVAAPPVSRLAAPDTVERMLTSVPALRRAGLDELADSIEAMAREVGLGEEPVAEGPPADARPPQPAEQQSESESIPARGASPVLALVARSRLGLGGAIVVVLASLGHVRGVFARILRIARHSLIRRREVVWGALAVSTMSLLVGWVITRLP
jgi:hypothetical protein